MYPRGVVTRRDSSGSSKYRGRGIVNSNLQRRGGRSRGVGRNNFINSRHASPRVAAESEGAELGKSSDMKEADVPPGSEHKKIFPKEMIKKGGKKVKSRATVREGSRRITESPVGSMRCKSLVDVNESCSNEKSEVKELVIVKQNKDLKPPPPVDTKKESISSHGFDDSKAIYDWKDQLSKYTSPSTGLKVLSVSSSSPGYVFTAGDRARIVRNIPGVVIINTACKGDRLVLGVDIEDDKLLKLIPEIEKESWKVSFAETQEKDTFSYLKGWKVIPRVDKGGMFQLIVNLKGQGQVKRRNQLLELVKDFNISKVVHGEGETILLVGHVLEFVAYSDCIRKEFIMERRHAWHPRPVDTPRPYPSAPASDQERYFWVKVKCEEIRNLSTAHKQYSVYHELSREGEVLQLEHQLFGVVDNYLAIVKDVGDITNLGEQFNFLEIWQDSLPQNYLPSYGVDGWGFYSVSGMFPEDVHPDTRNRFAEDMKSFGAVGFRNGETEYSFSLHFVNSRCLEQISRCAQYTSFGLTILSSMIRKPGLDKRLRRLVPAILKYKELKAANESNPELKEFQRAKMKKVEDCVGKQKQMKTKAICGQKCGNKEIEFNVESRANKNDQQNDCMMTEKENLVIIKDKVINDDAPRNNVKLAANTKTLVHTKAKSSEKEGKLGKKSKLEAKKDVTIIEETSLLKLLGKGSCSIASQIRNLGKFFAMVKDVEVTETGECGELLFKFPNKKKVDEVLQNLFKESAKSLDKLKSAPSKVIMESSKLFFKNKYGLVFDGNKNSSIEKLKKDLSMYGPLEIEARSRVSVVWFDTKVSLFKALTDPRIQKHKFVPSVHNFKSFVPEVREVDTEVKETNVEVDTDVAIKENYAKMKVKTGREKEIFKLTEREIFGFLWEKQKGNPRIRDDQVISRLLTNFIKKVSCEELTVEEDGLSVTFSTAAQYRSALEQFCPSEAPSQEQLAQLARKFTLLPASRKFGLFSRKQIKPRHFDMIKDCTVRNCGIWFTDKGDMFKVLRDPIISKIYPALFIDCRNIFILSSRNMLASGKASNNETRAHMPAAINMNVEPSKSAMTTAASVAPVKPIALDSVKTSKQDMLLPSTLVLGESSTLGHGVITRAAAAKLPVISSESFQPSASDNLKNTLAKGAVSKVSPTESIVKPENSKDTVIVSSASLSAKEHTNPHPVDSPLLGPGKAGLGGGKFGHIPSARLVRTGYKQCRMPVITRSKVVEEGLFLANKDKYRGKDVKEAAGMIENILHGKVENVGGETLREIKMKRVEGFLKDKLCVSPRTVEDACTEIIKTGRKMPDEEVEDYVANNNVLNELTIKEKKNEVIPEKDTEVGLTANVSSAMIDVKNAETKNDSGTVCPGTHPGNKEIDTNQEFIEPCDEAPILTADVLGLFTLKLSLPTGPDPALLAELEEDITWFESPVSIMCVENKNCVIEVKMRESGMAVAVLNGLKQKYPGLEGDTGECHTDIVPDEKTGLYTLCFTDSRMKKYKATVDKFKMYSKHQPVISKGHGKDQVVVGFVDKNAAVEALRDNIDSFEFPKLHISPASRMN